LGIVHCDNTLSVQLPILVPENLTVWQQNCLALIGVKEDRLIRVPRGSATHVTDAFVPSKSYIRSGNFGADAKGHGYFFMPEDLINYSIRVRDNFVNHSVKHNEDDHPARIVYISRKDAGQRFTTNETEAVEALRPFGIHYVTPTKLPIAALARIIHQADVVISAFGSAMLNICAARPGTTLIEIDHPAQDWIGLRMCQVLGYRHVICTRFRGQRGNYADTTDNPVDIPELWLLVKDALARSPCPPLL
jgi:capsular polysaccharide biosynthesis protein